MSHAVPRLHALGGLLAGCTATLHRSYDVPGALSDPDGDATGALSDR
ncbi:hypothetical protein OG271_02890 [Micromonospora rifamycinica]|nr:hypothetical protein [Micromonospora rifamycinica]